MSLCGHEGRAVPPLPPRVSLRAGGTRLLIGCCRCPGDGRTRRGLAGRQGSPCGRPRRHEAGRGPAVHGAGATGDSRLQPTHEGVRGGVEHGARLLQRSGRSWLPHCSLSGTRATLICTTRPLPAESRLSAARPRPRNWPKMPLPLPSVPSRPPRPPWASACRTYTSGRPSSRRRLRTSMLTPACWQPRSCGWKGCSMPPRCPMPLPPITCSVGRGGNPWTWSVTRRRESC